MKYLDQTVEKNPQCKFFNFRTHINALQTNKTILMCLFLTVLYLISGYWKWLEITVGLCAVGFMCFVSLQNAFCIFLYMHCFTASKFSTSICFIIMLIGFALILIVKFILGSIKGKYEYHAKIVKIICIFNSLVLIFSLFSSSSYYNLIYLAYLPIVYCIYEMKDSIDVKQGVNFLFGGIILSCLLGITFNYLPDFGYSAFENSSKFNFCGLVGQTNFLSIFSLFVLTYYMYRFLDNKINNIDFALCFACCSIITILTQCKLEICLLFLFSLITIILYLKKDFRKNIKYASILFVVFLAICGICYFQIWEILKSFGSVFTSDNFLSSLLGNKDSIWEQYLTVSFSGFRSIMFGSGILAKDLYVSIVGNLVDANSSYLFLIYHFGIAGTVLLGYIIYSIIKDTCYYKPKFAECLPLLFVLLVSLGETLFLFQTFSIIIAAVMVMFSTQKDEIIALKEMPQQSKIHKKHDNIANKIQHEDNQTDE